MASPHTVQGAPTPGPPHVRSGRRDGSFPVRITSRAFARRTVSSGMVNLQGPAGWSCQMPGGRTPVRVTREPDGRQLIVYTFKDRQGRGDGNGDLGAPSTPTGVGQLPTTAGGQ